MAQVVPSTSLVLPITSLVQSEAGLCSVRVPPSCEALPVSGESLVLGTLSHSPNALWRDTGEDRQISDFIKAQKWNCLTEYCRCLVRKALEPTGSEKIGTVDDFLRFLSRMYEMRIFFPQEGFEANKFQISIEEELGPGERANLLWLQDQIKNIFNYDPSNRVLYLGEIGSHIIFGEHRDILFQTFVDDICMTEASAENKVKALGVFATNPRLTPKQCGLLFDRIEMFSNEVPLSIRLVTLGQLAGNPAIPAEDALRLEEWIQTSEIPPRDRYTALQAVSQNPSLDLWRGAEARNVYADEARQVEDFELLQVIESKETWALMDLICAVFEEMFRRESCSFPGDLRHLVTVLPLKKPSLQVMQDFVSVYATHHHARQNPSDCSIVLFPVAHADVIGHSLLGEPSLENILRQATRNFHYVRTFFRESWASLVSGRASLISPLRDQEGQVTDYQITIDAGEHEGSSGLKLALLSPLSGSGKKKYRHEMASVQIFFGRDEGVLSLDIINIQGLRTDHIYSSKGQQRLWDEWESISGGAKAIDMMMALTIQLARLFGCGHIRIIEESAQFAYVDETRRSGKGGGLYSGKTRFFRFSKKAKDHFYALSLQGMGISEGGNQNFWNYLNTIFKGNGAYRYFQERVAPCLHALHLSTAGVVSPHPFFLDIL